MVVRRIGLHICRQPVRRKRTLLLLTRGLFTPTSRIVLINAGRQLPHPPSTAASHPGIGSDRSDVPPGRSPVRDIDPKSWDWVGNGLAIGSGKW